jgi:hypothetical protein
MGKPKKMLKVKDEHKSTVVAFGNSGLPLGQRDDLIDLAIIAQRSQDPSLLCLFDDLPTLEQLQKQKIEPLLPAISQLTKSTDKK